GALGVGHPRGVVTLTAPAAPAQLRVANCARVVRPRVPDRTSGLPTVEGMKITIVGTGYVGLSNAVVLAQHHQVVALDIDPVRVDQVNDRVCPLEDPELADHLQHHPLDLKATLDPDLAYEGADFVVV